MKKKTLKKVNDMGKFIAQLKEKIKTVQLLSLVPTSRMYKKIMTEFFVTAYGLNLLEIVTREIINKEIIDKT